MNYEFLFLTYTCTNLWPFFPQQDIGYLFFRGKFYFYLMCYLHSHFSPLFPIVQDASARAKEIFGKTVRACYSTLCVNFCFKWLLSTSFVLDTVMNIYIKTMVEDEDKEAVAQACTSMADIIKDYGYVAVEPCKF